MGSNVIKIIDNFYEDPYTVREEALSCEYTHRGSYPGLNSSRRFRVEEAMKKFEEILGTSVRWDKLSGNGYYRFSKASDRAKLDIHTDSLWTNKPFPQWGGVCYLNLPKDCQGGTSFWRHKQTGLERFPNLKEQTRVSRIAEIPNIPDHITHYFKKEGLDRSRWTEVNRVKMVFNRAVIFRANLFHSFTTYFGSHFKNARLVHLFFFDEVDYYIKTLIAVSKNKGPFSSDEF